jgi:hypothetical protein
MSTIVAGRIFREKRTLVLALLLLALCNVGFYAAVVYPLQARVASADDRAAAAAAALAAAEGEHTLAREMVVGKERAGRELQRFYEEILPTDQSAARRMTYLRLAQLARDANLAFDHRTFAVDEERGSSLRRLDITMLLGGNYDDIRTFIHDLERAKEFVVISQVELSQRERDQTGLQLAVHLATYYRTQPDAP